MRAIRAVSGTILMAGIMVAVVRPNSTGAATAPLQVIDGCPSCPVCPTCCPDYRWVNATVFPNPFSSYATLRLKVPAGGRFDIQVTNSSGTQVAAVTVTKTCTNQIQLTEASGLGTWTYTAYTAEPCTYHIQWGNLFYVPSGVYIFTVSYNGTVQTFRGQKL